jgi:hypothetical protein
MGIRFDIRAANWVAYLIQPDANMPVMDEPSAATETLRMFLHQLAGGFFSSPFRESELRSLTEFARRMLERLNDGSEIRIPRILKDLREFLAVSEFGRSWTAFIVPSCKDREIDRKLCSHEFLRGLVNIRPEDPGLILQLSDPPGEIFSLTDVFPAFKTALAHSTHWPGILLWTRSGDSVFLPFGSGRDRDIDERAEWIFSHLATTLGIDLDLFKQQYEATYPQVRPSPRSCLNIVHLSDLHIGSPEAGRRLPRVQQLIRNLIAEIGDAAQLLPIVSGDLMDNPEQEHLDRVRSFLDFLVNLGTSEPLTLLGNHDVRRDGYLADKFKVAMGLQGNPSRVVWFEDQKIAIACFNSVVDGRLARGYIGEQQLAFIGNELDRHRNWRDYALLSVVHHHPIPVQLPSWYVRPFYERIFGQWFEKTDSLEDAELFMRFSSRRSVKAVLHGHKHIPRIDKCSVTNIPIFGCGSTVGKVATQDRSTYMSINVISLDTSTGSMSARLLAERIPGEGLSEQKRHEAVHLSNMNS